MLVAILAGFFLFFGFSEQTTTLYIDNIQEGIALEIVDKGQRKDALVVVEKMKKETKRYYKSTSVNSKSLVKSLTKEQVVPDAEFNAIFEELNKKRAEYQNNMLGFKSELKQHLSREKWEKVFTAAGKEKS